MIEVKKIDSPKCNWDGCDESSDYEFTDAEVEVKIIDENGASATSVETVIIGHACPDHVESVNQFLIMTKKRDEV